MLLMAEEGKHPLVPFQGVLEDNFFLIPNLVISLTFSVRARSFSQFLTMFLNMGIDPVELPAVAVANVQFFTEW